MFDWVLNTSLLPLKNKGKKSFYMKNLKLFDSILWMVFNCLKTTEPLLEDSYH